MLSKTSSSQQPETDSPHAIGGWRNGMPILFSPSSTSFGRAEERLDSIIQNFIKLKGSIQEKQSFLNDELQQELDWAEQVYGYIFLPCLHY